MVFFTCILVICILYYLQENGLVYSVIIALVAELMNIFLTHTITKSVETKMKTRHRRAVEGYIKRIKSNKKTISELQQLQEKAAEKIYKANSRIKELEDELEEVREAAEKVVQETEDVSDPLPEVLKPAREPKNYADHLPDGSKKRPTRH